MTYVVNTAWKHTNPIDWKEMQKSLDEVMMNHEFYNGFPFFQKLRCY